MIILTAKVTTPKDVEHRKERSIRFGNDEDLFHSHKTRFLAVICARVAEVLIAPEGVIVASVGVTIEEEKLPENVADTFEQGDARRPQKCCGR